MYHQYESSPVGKRWEFSPSRGDETKALKNYIVLDTDQILLMIFGIRISSVAQGFTLIHSHW